VVLFAISSRGSALLVGFVLKVGFSFPRCPSWGKNRPLLSEPDELMTGQHYSSIFSLFLGACALFSTSFDVEAPPVLFSMGWGSRSTTCRGSCVPRANPSVVDFDLYLNGEKIVHASHPLLT